tara:strand:+ start:3706 stop:4578 length:873 start_codon:yes stop_codon:yes gene_type:complete
MTQLHSGDPLWENALIVAYDIEYSGNIQYNFGTNCAIWEWAAQIYTNSQTVETNAKPFHKYINPKYTRGIIPPPVEEKYAMPTDEEFRKKKALSFNKCIDMFCKWLDFNCNVNRKYTWICLCSHNNFRSDKLVIEHELKRHKIQLKTKLPIYFFDTLYFLRKTYPNKKSYAISNIFNDVFQMQHTGAHSALKDVEALLMLLYNTRTKLFGSLYLLYEMALTNISGIGTATEALLFSYNIKSIYQFYLFLQNNQYSIEGFYEGIGIEKSRVTNLCKHTQTWFTYFENSGNS